MAILPGAMMATSWWRRSELQDLRQASLAEPGNVEASRFPVFGGFAPASGGALAPGQYSPPSVSKPWPKPNY